MSVKDWRPPPVGPVTKKGLELARYLGGVSLLEGKGEIRTKDSGPVYVAIVHDGTGFTPGATIAVDQNPFHDLTNEVLEEAFEMMKDYHLMDESYVKELQKNWGDIWEEMLTELFDGKVWVFKNPVEALAAIYTDKKARGFIGHDDSE